MQTHIHQETGKVRPTQSGHILFLVLISITVIGIVLLSFLSLANSQNHAVIRSQAWNSAMPIVEAGLEEALTHLKHCPKERASNGWAVVNGVYYKERTFDDGRYEITMTTNMSPVIISRAFVRSPLQSTYNIQRAVQVTVTNDPVFSAAVQARDRVDLNGNNVLIDAFDSRDPNYSTLGGYDSLKIKDTGDVVSYSGITNSVNVGNANVYGRVITGPGGSLKVGVNGSVGSIAWQSVSNGVQPGWTSQTMTPNFPEIEAPTGGITPVGGSAYGYTFQYILNNDTYEINDLNGGVLVDGNAKLVVNNTMTISFIYIVTGYKLELYVKCPTVSVSGSVFMNSNPTAESFQYYGMPTHKTLQLSGNVKFLGTIYAPYTDIKIGGGGGTPINFCGAIVCNSLVGNGKVQIHYDEACRIILYRGFQITSWDEL